MQMSEMMMSSPQIFHVFCSQKWWKSHISARWESKTCRIMFALIYFDMGTCFYLFEQKMKIFKILYTKYMYIQNCEAMRSLTQLTHLHIHIDSSRNVSLKITKIKNFTSYFFKSDFHQILTVLFILFSSFYWINLNRDWISPLTVFNNLSRLPGSISTHTENICKFRTFWLT